MSTEREEADTALAQFLLDMAGEEGPFLEEDQAGRIVALLDADQERDGLEQLFVGFATALVFCGSESRVSWKYLSRLLLTKGVLDGKKIVFRWGATGASYVVTVVTRNESDALVMGPRQFDLSKINSVFVIEYADIILEGLPVYDYVLTFVEQEAKHESQEDVMGKVRVEARNKMKAIAIASGRLQRSSFNECSFERPGRKEQASLEF